MHSSFVGSDEDSKPSKQRDKNGRTASLKAELKHMLSQPLLPRGVSAKYITSGSRPIADNMLAGDCTSSHPFFMKLALTRLTDNNTILGLEKTEAGSDLVATRQKHVKKSEEEEEWGGIEC
jgi:ATP-dependent RNA helicase DDX24/MAK5